MVRVEGMASAVGELVGAVMECWVYDCDWDREGRSVGGGVGMGYRRRW